MGLLQATNVPLINLNVTQVFNISNSPFLKGQALPLTFTNLVSVIRETADVEMPWSKFIMSVTLACMCIELAAASRVLMTFLCRRRSKYPTKIN
jgi:hypothetical protein